MLNWQNWVENTFEREWKRQTADSELANSKISSISFHQKALVASGVISITALLGGCGSQADVTATAYEECKYVDANGIKYNCDDDNDSFYTSRGYSGRSTILPSTSSYSQYKASKMSSSEGSKGGIGGGGSGIFGG